MNKQERAHDGSQSQDTGIRTTSNPEPPNASATHRVAGLRVVTVSPGHGSEQSPEGQPSGSAAAEGTSEHAYLGSTIDGRYQLDAVIGQGGMGVVYRCTHKIIGKTVAMKVLRADLARDLEVTKRFLNEAKSASAIGNPHIIDISDFGQLPDGSTYFVMEYLDGTALSALVEGGKPVPVDRVLRIAGQLTEGLSAAHRANIIHRDLKPDNIILVPRGNDPDFVKILDFGIAKVSTDAEGAKLTRAGAVFGTPHYMSPEQAAGSRVDHRGDIYALGVILYELVSGRVPFDAENFMGILTQHLYKMPAPLRTLKPQVPAVPPGLEAIILKCLSKRPEQRYPSMDELSTELAKLKQGQVPDAVADMTVRSQSYNVPAGYFNKAQTLPDIVPEKNPFGRSRWPLYAGLAGVLVAVGLVVAIFAKSSLGEATPVANKAVQPVPKTQPKPTPVQRQPVPVAEDTAIASRQVVLAVEPLDAHVFIGKNDMGTSPIVIDVQEGQKVVVDIERKGYASQRIELESSDARRSVKLEKLKKTKKRKQPTTDATPAAGKPTPPKKKRTKLGGGEIINPWAE